MTREDWERVLTGQCSMGALCRELGMTRNTMKAIVSRKGWPPPPVENLPALPDVPAPSPVASRGGGDAVLRYVRLRLQYLARNRTESHQQVLRIIQKLRCHLESWIDEVTDEGKLIGPSIVKRIGHALAWLERIEGERQALIMVTGESRVGFSLIEHHVKRVPKPRAAGDALLEDAEPEAVEPEPAP